MLLQGVNALRGRLRDPYVRAWETELKADPTPGVLALAAALRPTPLTKYCMPCPRKMLA